MVSSKSKSKSPDRQPDYKLLDPSELKIELSDYSNYLSNNTYHPSPVVYNEILHKPVKRNYAYLERNTWDDVPLYTPESQKSPSEKPPSKKRKRVVSKKNRGRRGPKGGKKRTTLKN